jgi:hypothetical protein
MTIPADPTEREPKGDHNRRLSLGLDLDAFAAEAGVTTLEREAGTLCTGRRCCPAASQAHDHAAGAPKS